MNIDRHRQWVVCGAKEILYAAMLPKVSTCARSVRRAFAQLCGGEGDIQGHSWAFAGIRAPGGSFGKARALQCPASLSQPRLCKTHAWGGLGRSKRQGGKNAEVIRAESHYNTNTVESRGLGGLGCVGGF
jgi:hypothetical protein